jgi:DUF438 domain-containing protein
MSELSQTKEYRQEKLIDISKLIIKTGNARDFIINNKDFIDTVIPSDFITLFDTLVVDGYDIAELKMCANKVLNVFYQPINNYKGLRPESNTFIWLLEQNNIKMESILNEISPVFKALNKDLGNTKIKKVLVELFNKLNLFNSYYVVKENIIFPVIEQKTTDYRCLQIMWSFHDDIRRNIKNIINSLESDSIDVKQFNRWVGDVFFNMLAIKFREEKILYPFVLSVVEKQQLEQMQKEALEMKLPFVNIEKEPETNIEKDKSVNTSVNLGTGVLNIEQIKLIFNHLPVDITYVDENDTVQYFSTPKHRIFPRTTAVLGRQVSNCHPPESVHVVEKIVDSFRNGEKDKADFWIKIMGKYVMIQYFAVRDDNNNYKGVLEVSQEISDIKAIDGEKRLLDW